METRIALIGIIVENMDSVERLNALLHESGELIVGRMGVPYRDKGISIISLIVDARETEIASLAGKIGQLPGVMVKTMYAKAGGGS